MKLAEAIRAGIPLVPASKGSAFKFDATGHEWAQRKAHKKDLLGADALGTALIGMTGDAMKTVERVYDGPEGSPLTILRRLYPELWVDLESCPACTKMRASGWTTAPPRRLFSLICHLQDSHDWSRESVVAYLEGRKK